MLSEAETLRGLEMIINDPNSLSEMMSMIRQHTEKKKAFTHVDFLNKILQISIGQSFNKGSQHQTREAFQNFILAFVRDMKQYMTFMRNEAMQDVFNLKSQAKILKERIQMSYA